VILSFVALVIIEAFSTFVDLGNASVYILVGAMLNVPRFLILEIVIGYLYKRLYGKPNFGLDRSTTGSLGG